MFIMNDTPPKKSLADFTGYERMPSDEIGFVLIGPSGVGKSTLRDYICSQSDAGHNYVKYLPLTTRSQRPGEGSEYRFVNADEMKAAKTSSNVVFGNASYGNEFLTLWPERLPAGSHYLYIYLPEAAVRLKETFPNTRIIQIAPASTDELKTRIITRDPNINSEELEKRINSAQDELATGAGIADTIVLNNGSIDEVAHNLKETLSRLSV